jgi:hypothetical protein
MLFNSDGLVLPKVETPAITAPKSGKSGKLKKKKVKKTQVERDAMLEDYIPDGTYDDGLKRIKAAKFALFGHTGGRTPEGTIEDARIESKKILQKHKNEMESFIAKKPPGTFIPGMADDTLAPTKSDDRLVDDSALMDRWKSTLKNKLKSSPKKRTKAPSKTRASPKAALMALKRKLDAMIKKKGKSGKRRAPQIEPDPSEVPGEFDVTFGGRKFVGDEDDLTFMEGSKEDLEFFGTELSEIPGDQAEKNTIVRPYLRKKLSDLKSHNVNLAGTTPEEFLDRLQASDDSATKKFIDTYDHDMVSKPPTGTDVPAIFKDVKGSSNATLRTMGTWVSFKTRGIRFDGSNLLTWKVREHLISQDVAQVKFNFHAPPIAPVDVTYYGAAGVVPQLDNFNLDFELPVKLATQGEPGSEPTLEEVKIRFKASHDSKAESFSISLVLADGKTIIRPTSPGIDENGYPATFDDQIKQIQMQLPAKSYLKTCWNCALSEYSPVNKQNFGGLGCFRQWPNITTLRNPMELLRNWKKRIEDVQETHSCESFKRRTKPRINGLNPTRTPIAEGIKRREDILKAQEIAAQASKNL